MRARLSRITSLWPKGGRNCSLEVLKAVMRVVRPLVLRRRTSGSGAMAISPRQNKHTQASRLAAMACHCCSTTSSTRRQCCLRQERITTSSLPQALGPFGVTSLGAFIATLLVILPQSACVSRFFDGPSLSNRTLTVRPVHRHLVDGFLQVGLKFGQALYTPHQDKDLMGPL